MRPDLVAPGEFVVFVARGVGLADLQPRATGKLDVVDGEAAEVRQLLDAATRAVVDAVGQAARHHFIPWCDDTAAVYPALDLLVCPSEEEETFGRVVAEAQACGVPVIARDRGGLPEAMIAGETGLLWRGDAPHDLADLIGRLIDDSPRRQAMAAAAPASAARFSTDLVVNKFIAQLTTSTADRARPIPGRVR